LLLATYLETFILKKQSEPFQMKSNIFHATVITFILGISGCANIPSHVIIAPDIMVTPALSYHNKQAQLNVTDMRTANHVVQIMRKGEAATLISAQEKLEETITNTLTQQWKKQNLAINISATNVIKVEIEKAVISVTQQTMEYKVQTEIVLKVTIDNGTQTLTSTFKNRGNSDGPLQADVAVLERNFNQRLAKLLQQILGNQKINTFLL